MTSEEIVLKKKSLEDHAREASILLIAKEGEDPSLPPVESAPSKYFFQWILEFRLETAQAIAKKLSSFKPVADLVEQAESIMAGGKTRRDVLAAEFNTAYRFHGEQSYSGNQDYVAFITSLLFALISIDSNAAKRDDVKAHARELIIELEAFASIDNYSSRILTICSEWFSNYGGFRKTFLSIYPELHALSKDDNKPSIEDDEEVKVYSSGNGSEQDLLPLKTFDAPASSKEEETLNTSKSSPVPPPAVGPAPVQKPSPKPQRPINSNRVPTQQSNPPQPKTLNEALAPIFANLPDLERVEDYTAFKVDKSATEIRRIMESFARSVGADISFPAATEKRFVALIYGFSDTSYKAIEHFGHFSTSDRWAATVVVTDSGDRTQVEFVPYGQGKFTDRLKHRTNEILLIEMSIFYCEKLLALIRS